MDWTHTCLILFQGEPLSLGEPLRLFAETRLLVKQEGEVLWVQWNEGPQLRVSLVSEKPVPQRVLQAAGGTSCQSFLAQCNGWFQIEFDDLDEVLDEINTLIEVQLTLESATAGLVFCGWNSFFRRKEGNWRGHRLLPDGQTDYFHSPCIIKPAQK